MNFQEYSSGGVTYTSAQQAAAWDAYIKQDEYLNENRGKYAERGGVTLPMVFRADLSITQEVYTELFGKRNSLQFRVDFLNIGNMLNKEWGVSQRMVNLQPLIVPTSAQGGAADSQGKAQYRLRAINGKLMSTSTEYNANRFDVFQIQLSLRYTFN